MTRRLADATRAMRSATRTAPSANRLDAIWDRTERALSERRRRVRAGRNVGLVVIGLVLVLGLGWGALERAPASTEAATVVARVAARVDDHALEPPVARELDPTRVGPIALASVDGATVSLPSAHTLELDAVATSRSVRFAEASRIDVERGSLLRSETNTARLFVTRVVQGAARFQVTPGGPRTWLVRAGATTVEVVGTAFSVRREGDDAGDARTRGTIVRVEHGHVIVRHESVPGREWSLYASDTVELNDADALPIVRGPTSRAETVATTRRARNPTPSRAGASEPARALATPAAPRAATLLMAEADAARLGGSSSTAIPLLERVLRDHPTDPEAPLAALSLGRLLRERGDISRARAACARAVALGVPASLRAEAERCANE